MPRKLLQEKRSAGAVALARLGMTQAAIADRLEKSRSLVGHWISGRRVPTLEDRGLMAARLKIGAHLWDQVAGAEAKPKKPAARKPAKRSAAPKPSPGAGEPPPRGLGDTSSPGDGSVRTKARRLEAMVDELLEGLLDDDAWVTPLEQAKVMASAASTLTLLGKLTGETQEISEARILRLPAWRRIQDVLVDALKPWPEALLAAGESLQRFGDER